MVFTLIRGRNYFDSRLKPMLSSCTSSYKIYYIQGVPQLSLCLLPETLNDSELLKAGGKQIQVVNTEPVFWADQFSFVWKPIKENQLILMLYFYWKQINYLFFDNFKTVALTAIILRLAPHAF